MGASKKFRPVRAFTVSGFSGTREDVFAAFRQMVKSLRCPACEVEFSDFAVDWGDAWLEGRLDL